VNLAHPISVLIVYGTVIVNEDGLVHFYDDIYGHDAALEKTLAKGYPYPGYSPAIKLPGQLKTRSANAVDVRAGAEGEQSRRTPGQARKLAARPVSKQPASEANHQFYGLFLLTGFALPTLGLSRVKESSALKGNCRTDCCPVLLRVISTRRFCARVTV